MKIIAFTTITVLVLVGGEAEAMLCKPREPRDVAATAEVAFLGTVVTVSDSAYLPSPVCERRTKQSPQCGSKLVAFRISEVLRGQVGSEVAVLAEDSCSCLAPEWRVGSSYLVVANKNAPEFPGSLIAANICNGTGAVDERTPQFIKAFRGRK